MLRFTPEPLPPLLTHLLPAKILFILIICGEMTGYRQPQTLSLKNVIDAKAANTMTLILSWYR